MSTKKTYKKVLNRYNCFRLNYYRFFSLKKNRKTIFLFGIFNIFILSNICSEPLKEYISSSIKTVQFHRNEWPLSYPIIRLNSEQQLLLSFDELGSSTKNFQYTIVLCDADWNISDLMVTEYISGSPINPIIDYSFSFNTTIDYIHYRLKFPNEDIRPLRSGNYMLMVFEDYDQNNPVLKKKFMISEPMVNIVPRIRNTASSSIRASHHEINFEVHHPGFTIRNPMDEISATIIQNGRKDNRIQGLRPQFVRNDLLDFNYNRETMMEGGNEFRYLDIRSYRFYSDKIEEIVFLDPFYHVRLFADLPRNPSSYQYRQDLNGRYYIEVQERSNADLEADYMFVHFRLRVNQPQLSQRVYLNGALTNWELNESSQMHYNPTNNAYELSLLLKQGYYNYHYLVVEEGEKTGKLFPMENSFQQTENDYLILIYYKGLTDRVHRLIGAETFNSTLPQPRSRPGH
ncbi:type IX secretion system plug protein [Natronoflexus pectinivorans]|uniref:Uncharacterized protein DUF5103 n=1 Tax=Natronoflexus pectinivorans TaxID=682526 RepID=A0A4R2GL42_9BACT|nr:DUF5103 domain-containing protein [Natronoflexus pectinivorans]TCO09613.1 uncharacterized protein DUF5103 [Natronoflexus pectinivorans]